MTEETYYSIPELDDLEELTSSSPQKLAITVERLTGAVKRLREINITTAKNADNLARKLEEQDKTIEDLMKFKNEIRTGSKVIAWMATGTIAIIGALATFFSGFGTKLFSGTH